MRHLTLVPLAALALAGCNNSQPSVSLTNASPEEVAKAATESGATDTMFNPGKWETRVELIDTQIPGIERLPPQLAAQMKSKMAEAHISSSCMSPEDAKRPDAKVIAGRDKGNCTFEHFNLAGGKIDAKMTCSEPNGATEMTLNGTFTRDTMDEVAEMTMAMPSGQMHTKMKITARRVGDCTAGDK